MVEFAKNLPIRGNILSGMDQILDKPRCSVYRAGADSVANNTLHITAWDTLDYQSEGMWNTTNPSRITCITAGTYAFLGWIGWASNATAYRELYFQKNTGLVATIYGQNIVQAVNGTITSQGTASHIPLNAGDYVELVSAQGSGGALSYVVATATDRENGFQACLIST